MTHNNTLPHFATNTLLSKWALIVISSISSFRRYRTYLDHLVLESDRCRWCMQVSCFRKCAWCEDLILCCKRRNTQEQWPRGSNKLERMPTGFYFDFSFYAYILTGEQLKRYVTINNNIKCCFFWQRMNVKFTSENKYIFQWNYTLLIHTLWCGSSISITHAHCILLIKNRKLTFVRYIGFKNLQSFACFTIAHMFYWIEHVT